MFFMHVWGSVCTGVLAIPLLEKLNKSMFELSSHSFVFYFGVRVTSIFIVDLPNFMFYFQKDWHLCVCFFTILDYHIYNNNMFINCFHQFRL